MTTVNIYLTFGNNCQEAFDFYKSVFGGDFSYVGKFKDMPPNPDHPVAEADLEKIMHISLPISKETVLMGSDSSEAFGNATVVGNNFSISVNTDTEDEARRIWDGLSAGGRVNMPLQETFWGSLFGMFTDQFGINWQVNHELAKHAAFEADNQNAE